MSPNGTAPHELTAQINASTRSLHTTLNRFITSRLPLCLPPFAPDNRPYATGILHFAHIYLAFESVWADLRRPASKEPASPLLSSLLADPQHAEAPTASPQMLRFLNGLRPNGLARSERIKRDLESLTGFRGTDLDVLLSRFPGTEVENYCNHIRETVPLKPHVLISYAWCYYMAVFSGGRWIRSELLKAGDDFWRNKSVKEHEKSRDVPIEEKGLALWNFDGDEDGEDIKAEFKKRLLAVEEFFTPEQRQDVIQESQEIFRYSIKLVEELDKKLGTRLDETHVGTKEQATKGSAVVPRPGNLLVQPGLKAIGSVLAVLVLMVLFRFHA